MLVGLYFNRPSSILRIVSKLSESRIRVWAANWIFLERDRYPSEGTEVRVGELTKGTRERLSKDGISNNAERDAR